VADNPIPLAQAHPAETWAALGVLATGIVALLGVLYRRVNKDIQQLDDSLEDLSDDLDDQVSNLHKDLNGIGREINKVQQTIAQFSTSSVFTAQDIEKLLEEVKQLNNRLMTIEIEHKHCMKLHDNLIGHPNGGK